jgi:biotin carboxylase
MSAGTVLVIGAGPAQADAIRRAGEIGYRVIATDRDARAPGFAVAARHATIDVRDVGGNLALASREAICGVTSFATDVSLQTVLGVREALGLPGTARRAVEAGLDKILHRTLFAGAGVPQPDFVADPDVAKAARCLKDWGGALVVKPAGGSGSRGVQRVCDESGLSAALDAARLEANGGRILCERVIAGRELSVETISFGGHHRVLAIGERMFQPGTFAVASAIHYPARLDGRERDAVEGLAVRVLDAVGVDHSPGHIEVMLTGRGPSVVEVGVRGGGFFIFSKIVRETSGYDIVGNWARFCAGDPVEAVPENLARRGVVLRYLHAGIGVIRSISGIEPARSMPGILSCGAFVETGDRSGPILRDGDRSGWVIAAGEGLEEAEERAECAARVIRFELGQGIGLRQEIEDVPGPLLA